MTTPGVVKESAVISLWQGSDVDQNRPLMAQRPCSCGCDQRDGSPMVGYVSGSRKGYGITIEVADEVAYQRLVHIFGGEA